ncbi:MAG: 1-deoxy-D-xylulose-5-phosphate reductoisomerase [Dehalococcoidales bacterium]|nr:1-deoxy-D-xylulose-5-phosphate reductoisomerase [Dehalococcoidales bacterium]
MAEKVKRIALLGSTGSIGRQTLDVVRALHRRFKVVGLAAGSNLKLLCEQAKEFTPEYICYARSDNKAARDAIAALDCKFLPLEEMASRKEVDVVVIATSGLAGLGAVLAAVKAGKTIALANKESLVAAGAIITAEAEKNKARILPVDSEHSAIWQCLRGEKQPPRRIILTASGGPFLDYPPEQMNSITVVQALAHPSWKMGKKVTVDSATLMNKGLEVIEARWLFNIPIEDVKVLVHPQSIVHSMVEFADGSAKAQLSRPDMRLPIRYALTYPNRLPNNDLPGLDWDNFSDLEFRQPDIKKFPCLSLAIAAGKKGGTFPAVLCAADEVAVGLFLREKIGFTDIPRVVDKVLQKHDNVSSPSLDDILAADKWARQTALETARSILK